MLLSVTWNAMVATAVDGAAMINAVAEAAGGIPCSTTTQTAVAQTVVEIRTTAPEITISGHHHRTTLNKGTVVTTRAAGLLRPTMAGVITTHRQEAVLQIHLTTHTALEEVAMAPMTEDPVVDMDLDPDPDPALDEAVAEGAMEAMEAMEVHLPMNMEVRLLTDMGVHLPVDMEVHPPMDTAVIITRTMVVEVEVDIK